MVVVAQINFAPVAASEPLFNYVRRFLEICFIVAMLFAFIKIFSSSFMEGNQKKMVAFKWLASQNQQLVTNMQRVFADTVSSTISDPGIKSVVSFFGICILPSISDAISTYRKEAMSSSAGMQKMLYLM